MRAGAFDLHGARCPAPPAEPSGPDPCRAGSRRASPSGLARDPATGGCAPPPAFAGASTGGTHTARSSRIAVAAAALLAACGTREPRATPFAITVTGPTGAPVTGPNPVLVEGRVTSRAATTLVVDDPLLGGAVTVSFDPAASPGVAFPPQLQGAAVAIEVEESGTIRSPAGALVPYPALRVFQQDAPSGASFQFFLGEGDLVDAQGLPVPPPLLSPGDPDVPGFSVFADNVQFEPSSCGLYYYDLLRVDGDAAIALRRGESGSVRVDQRIYLATGVQVTRPPWNVRHVQSFHRIDCSSPPRAWTQLAAWRDPEGG